MHRVVGSLKSFPGDLRHKEVETLDRVSIYRRAHTLKHPFTHYEQVRDDGLMRCIYSGGNQNTKRKPSKALGEHSNSTHTGQSQESDTQPWRYSEFRFTFDPLWQVLFIKHSLCFGKAYTNLGSTMLLWYILCNGWIQCHPDIIGTLCELSKIDQIAISTTRTTGSCVQMNLKL